MALLCAMRVATAEIIGEVGNKKSDLSAICTCQQDKKSMTIEKRQSPRRELKLQATLMVDGLMPAKVRTMDIGKYGMSLIGIAKQLTVEQHVNVSFDMFFACKLYHVAVSARVSHCLHTANDGYKVGLQFFSIDAEVADLLAKYVGS